MRINKFIAQATGMSRRAADAVIAAGRITVNGQPIQLGQEVQTDDTVALDGRIMMLPATITTIILNKPVGYVCSRDGQGSKTIYELLPSKLHHLKPVGRLDKDSSGLLLLTNDGDLAHRLTHPSFQKEKLYEIELNKPLRPEDKKTINKGIAIDNEYVSRLRLVEHENRELKLENSSWRVAMNEGHNRQIRRTFAALDYKVTKLHRTQFGEFRLSDLQPGAWQVQ